MVEYVQKMLNAEAAQHLDDFIFLKMLNLTTQINQSLDQCISIIFSDTIFLTIANS